MEENKREETVFYKPGEELDEALKTYEKTKTEDEIPKDMIESAEVAVKKSNKKKVIIILSIVVVVLAAAIVSIFLVLDRESTGVVVQKSSGGFSFIGNKEYTLGHSIGKYKYSADKKYMVFTEGENLYLLQTSRAGKDDFVKKISENVSDEFYILNNEYAVFSSGNKVLAYSFSSNKSTMIAENCDEIFVQNKGKLFFFTKKNGDKTELYKTDVNSIEKLSENAETVEFHIENNKDTKLIFAEKTGDVYKVKLCSEDGSISEVSNEAVWFYSGDEKESWDNIYFVKKSEMAVTPEVKFEDKYADSDAQITEPDASDYQKTSLFGLIKYTDPSTYKKAYVEYQDKLTRDNAREFAKNYSFADNSVETFDLYCYSNGNVSLVVKNVDKDRVYSYSESGQPKVIYEKVKYTSSAVIEIADIATEILGSDGQEEFNAHVNKRITDKSEVAGNFLAWENGEIKTDFEIGKKIRMSSDLNLILNFKSKSKIELYRIKDDKIDIEYTDDLSEGYDFSGDKFVALDKDGNLILSDANKTEVICKNVTSYEILDDNSLIIISDAVYLYNGKTEKICDKSEDFFFINNDEFFALKNHSIEFYSKGKMKVLSDSIEKIL